MATHVVVIDKDPYRLLSLKQALGHERDLAIFTAGHDFPLHVGNWPPSPSIRVALVNMSQVRSVRILAMLRLVLPHAALVGMIERGDTESMELAVAMGTRGAVPPDASPVLLLSAVRDVAQGTTSFDNELAEELREKWAFTKVPPGPSRLAGSDALLWYQRGVRRSLGLLTARQREVVSLLSEGLSNRQIAGKLSVSENTIAFHLDRIFRTMQVRSRMEVALQWKCAFCPAFQAIKGSFSHD